MSPDAAPPPAGPVLDVDESAATDRAGTDGQPGWLGVHLVAALLVGLVLVLPLRAAFDTTSYGALYAWIGVGLLVAVGTGALLHLTGVERVWGLVLATVGCYGVAVLLFLALLGSLPDAGTDAEVALLAGTGGAALAAVAAALVVRRTPDGTGAAVLGGVVALVGVMLVASLGPSAYDRVDEAREDAALAADLEEVGLAPYLPEIDGLEPEFSSTTRLTEPETGASRLTGYAVRYERPDSGIGDASVTLDVQLHTEPSCEADGIRTCRERDGYVLVEQEGRPVLVRANRGGLLLEVDVREAGGDLASPDEIGAALAEADEVEWADVLGTDD